LLCFGTERAPGVSILAIIARAEKISSLRLHSLTAQLTQQRIGFDSIACPNAFG
jgi:hypothetical protein